MIFVIILTPHKGLRTHGIEESDFLCNLLLHVELISSLLKLSLQEFKLNTSLLIIHNGFIQHSYLKHREIFLKSLHL